LSPHSKGPSIKDALAGKLGEEKLTAKEQHEIYTRKGETKDFTAEALKLKWKEFVNRLGDRPNLQSTLSRVPSLKQDFQLVLEIDNSVQDDLINTIKPELVSWLRKELKNSKIQLVTRISETEKEKIIYSDSDKYMEMLKKNPYSEDQAMLDLEYICDKLDIEKDYFIDLMNYENKTFRDYKNSAKIIKLAIKLAKTVGMEKRNFRV